MIEIAVALAAIAARTLMAQLIRGAPMSQDSWAEIGADVAATLVSSATAVGQRRRDEPIKDLGRKIDLVVEQLNDLQVRDFDKHIRAGARYLRDLPVEWRTDQDRREMIRDARHAFVQAVAVGEEMQDTERQALAEIFIAGCWLWVPSMDDVRNTLGNARRILERAVLFDPTPPTEAYTAVVKLCKTYGERPPVTAIPFSSRDTSRSSPEARIVVTAQRIHGWIAQVSRWPSFPFRMANYTRSWPSAGHSYVALSRD